MGRAPCCDKANVKRGPWSPEEDQTLKSYIQQHGTGGNWISLPSKAGLRRCGKSCRLRWLNYLRPDIKHGKFTEEEDRVIFSLYNEIGSRWSIIAAKLNGRTDNDVKNHWNTKLKKQLMIKEQNAYYADHSLSGSSDHESYSYAKFPTLKTETNEESMSTMPNQVQGVSGYDSSLSYVYNEPGGFMVPSGLSKYNYASKTTISPNSAGSEVSHISSTVNGGNVMWSDSGVGVEESGFLIDILNYGEGIDNGCHLLPSSIECGDQKSDGTEEQLGIAGMMPSFSAMLSDYMYDFKPHGLYQSGLIDQYRSSIPIPTIDDSC